MKSELFNYISNKVVVLIVFSGHRVQRKQHELQARILLYIHDQLLHRLTLVLIVIVVVYVQVVVVEQIDVDFVYRDESGEASRLGQNVHDEVVFVVVVRCSAVRARVVFAEFVKLALDHVILVCGRAEQAGSFSCRRRHTQ